jgi:hypothetical protein
MFGYPLIPPLPRWERVGVRVAILVPLPNSLSRGRCEKFGIRPLTLPSPCGGDGKPVEINNKFPPP